MLVVTGTSGVAAFSGATSFFMKSTVWWVTNRSQSSWRPSIGASRGSICSHDWNFCAQNADQ